MHSALESDDVGAEVLPPQSPRAHPLRDPIRRAQTSKACEVTKASQGANPFTTAAASAYCQGESGSRNPTGRSAGIGGARWRGPGRKPNRMIDRSAVPVSVTRQAQTTSDVRPSGGMRRVDVRRSTTTEWCRCEHRASDRVFAERSIAAPKPPSVSWPASWSTSSHWGEAA